MLGKEKTAMCLVNELSRYNKVSPHETDWNDKVKSPYMIKLTRT